MENQTPKLTLLTYSRGTAALFVVIFHIAQEIASRFNYQLFFHIFYPLTFGVDFFFVLSGFILFYAHRHDFHKRGKTASFVKKRLLRIFPPYWILLSFSLLVFFITDTHFAKSAFVHPFFLVQSYLLFPLRTPVIPPSWTLSYELFFYALLTCGIFFRQKKTLLILLFVYLACIIPLNILLPEKFFLSIGGWVEVAIRYYVGEFFLGFLAAHLLFRLPQYKKTTDLYLLLAAFLFIGIDWGCELFLPSLTFLFRLLLFSPGIALLLFSMTRLEQKLTIRVNKIFFLIGESSYVLYLMQALFILFYFKLLTFFYITKDFFSMTTIGIGGIIFVIIPAVLFHVWIEKPLLQTLNH